ncbi:MAG TPA: tripartite tricarboxylate transporter TctB family protein [Burkholderiales bacterium]|nr:tripartite tricarboxylate transporter TctB family protein [Burkholderiales bacterium]
MEGDARRLGDLWSGLALALLGGTIVAQAWQWDYSTSEGPGPGFFPLWYGIAMLALSALLVLSNLRRGPPGKPADWPRIGRALACWLALAVSVSLFKTLGFVLSFALLTYFIVAVMYRRPTATAAIVAAATGAGFYLVFNLALGLALPAGMLGF